ncbi:aminotransferase class V-fold PLP-dependent enzyme [Pedomonas mirosovicensis]|uniref:aminotransferase class V-fold PLP-dependent enzyme n=1 Tax=Pedomonas mirosovicensis TaxID=2908641 RepID=UPI002169B2F7|nr:aminotransferase class V-fold PLP-dependent enzyme [Pedomonas mirosovicensis]MCH8686288.1 aminotransferase class V-fold PLP-dependent enzyme [Pedomonas mirosovicensis]
MDLDRRTLLTRATCALGAGVVAASCGSEDQAAAGSADRAAWESYWAGIRRQFPLNTDDVHLSAMLIASHPQPVRQAIEWHRRALDASPAGYLQDNNGRLREAALAAAGRYMGVDPRDIALTDSTTMGVALVYNGLMLRPGEEVLTTEQDYYVTHESLRLAAQRTGARVRKIALYEDIRQVTPESLAERVLQEIRPETRVLALTWVHSSTGLKIPVRMIADGLARINASRSPETQVLFGLDGVHGFGNQNQMFGSLGCDFFMAGCHKWLFGPRGTGIIVATPRGWAALRPSIPSFIDGESWTAWFENREPQGASTAARMTPGGFKPYEHQWALAEAFAFHEGIGPHLVQTRTEELATQLKEGLARMPNVTLQTPRRPDLSAGIVSFDVKGMTPAAVVKMLKERRIIASVAPYATRHVRLTPCIYNSPADIERALREVRAVAMV